MDKKRKFNHISQPDNESTHANNLQLNSILIGRKLLKKKDHPPTLTDMFNLMNLNKK